MKGVNDNISVFPKAIWKSFHSVVSKNNFELYVFIPITVLKKKRENGEAYHVWFKVPNTILSILFSWCVGMFPNCFIAMLSFCLY